MSSPPPTPDELRHAALLQSPGWKTVLRGLHLVHCGNVLTLWAIMMSLPIAALNVFLIRGATPLVTSVLLLADGAAGIAGIGLALFGRCCCCAAPAESRGRSFVIASLAGFLLTLATLLALLFLGWHVNPTRDGISRRFADLAPLGPIALASVSHTCFVAHMARLAQCLEDPSLAKALRSYVAVFVVAVDGFLLFAFNLGVLEGNICFGVAWLGICFFMMIWYLSLLKELTDCLYTATRRPSQCA